MLVYPRGSYKVTYNPVIDTLQRVFFKEIDQQQKMPQERSFLDPLTKTSAFLIRLPLCHCLHEHKHSITHRIRMYAIYGNILNV